MKITKLASIFFPFVAQDWVSQSDSLRTGGVSFSNLDVAKNGKSAVWTGKLDTSVFNAGFSGVRTVGGAKVYDWSKWKGVALEYETPDCSLIGDRTFTLVIKDRLQQGDDGPPESGVPRDPALPPGEDTVDFQFDWQPPCSKKDKHKTKVIFAKFSDFKAGFRGRDNIEGTLNLKTVRRFQFRIRSLDQTRRQDGEYKMVLKGIKLWK